MSAAEQQHQQLPQNILEEQDNAGGNYQHLQQQQNLPPLMQQGGHQQQPLHFFQQSPPSYHNHQFHHHAQQQRIPPQPQQPYYQQQQQQYHHAQQQHQQHYGVHQQQQFSRGPMEQHYGGGGHQHQQQQRQPPQQYMSRREEQQYHQHHHHHLQQHQPQQQQHYYYGAATGDQQQQQQELEEEGDGGIYVAETCDVTSSSPSPDFSRPTPRRDSFQQQQLPMATGGGGSGISSSPFYGHAQNQRQQSAAALVHGAHHSRQMPLSLPLLNTAQPPPAFRVPQQQSNYLTLGNSSTAAGGQQQPQLPHQVGQQQSQSQQNQQSQQQKMMMTVGKRTTPFEEEEEEEDDDGEEYGGGEREFGGTPTQTAQRQHQRQAQASASSAGQPPAPQSERQGPVTRAGRRKQIFENNNRGQQQGTGMGPIERRKSSEEMPEMMGSDLQPMPSRKAAAAQSFPFSASMASMAVSSNRKEREKESTRPLFDRELAHAQTVQRIGTTEGWRRMNDWLKGVIKAMDLPKLKQLLVQLSDAEISVDLLRANDTPKLVKDLQKCADKDIASMASKMVTKWMQSVREENSQQKQTKTAKTDEKKGGNGNFSSSLTAAADKRRKQQGLESADGAGSKPLPVGLVAQPVKKTSVGSQPTSSAGSGFRSREGSLSVPKATEAKQAIGTGVTAKTEQQRPKPTVKAKAKISRPRLTGLEGDETAEQTQKIGAGNSSKATAGNGAKATITPASNSVNESPLTRILAATNKFQAQQPKRKPVELMVSDNFMESLFAADNVQPKKAKIVRKKLNPAAGTAAIKNEHPGGPTDMDLAAQSQEAAAAGPSSAMTAAGKIKNRVRFVDELGRDLVQIRIFEIEEGERVNVTKMDREAIKHFDSQREKELLMGSGFGRFSVSLTDPSLMPPGHQQFVGFGRPPVPVGVPPPFAAPVRPPILPLFPSTQSMTMTSCAPGGMPGHGRFAMGRGALFEERFPWRFFPVDHAVQLVETGSNSVAKGIELERQRTTMACVILPISLPVSELDEQEMKRQQDESMDHVPKIIPLELIAEMHAELATTAGDQLPLERQTKEEEGERGLKMVDEPMETVGEDKDGPREGGGDETDDSMEQDRGTSSPVRPFVRKFDNNDEEMEIIEPKVEQDNSDEADQLLEREKQRLDDIASPEPEAHLADGGAAERHQKHVQKTIKEIPTEQITHDEESGDEEDMDIRDLLGLQRAHQQRTDSPAANSPLPEEQKPNLSCASAASPSLPQTATTTTSATGNSNLSELMKQLSRGADLSSLLKKIDTIVSGGQGKQDNEQQQQQQPTAAVVADYESESGRQLQKADTTTTTSYSNTTDLLDKCPDKSNSSAIGNEPNATTTTSAATGSGGDGPAGPPPSTAIPLPPTHLFPHLQPPFSTAQQMFGTNGGSRAPSILFPPPDFSTPPPGFPLFGPLKMGATTPTTSSAAALAPQKSIQQSQGSEDGTNAPLPPQNVNIPPIGLLQTPPVLATATTGKQQQEQSQQQNVDGRGGQSPMAMAGQQQHHHHATPIPAGPRSPGPPGLDEGGSPPQQPQDFQQQILMSPTEARNFVGKCQFFIRTGTCGYGDKCKFAHDENSITLGIQMAMRGVDINSRGAPYSRGRGGGRGSGGFGGPTGRSGGFRSGHGELAGQPSSGFDDRRTSNRRSGGTGTGGGRYDISPVRNPRESGGGGASGRERRYAASPAAGGNRRRRSGGGRSRSRSPPSRRRHNSRRHRRTRTRSRSRDHRSGRKREQQKRERSSSSSSSTSSSSTSTFSRSPTPKEDRNKYR